MGCTEAYLDLLRNKKPKLDLEEMGYIGAHGVAALHKYKYSGVDHSYTAKYVLQPFWSRFITLTGFMFLLTSALLGYIYSPRLDSAPPRWVNFAHGLLLFLYQTFDAVDGKQARRTNSSSPLGELFDHGCDALACAFEGLAFGSTAMCGRTTFWFWVISAVPFYCATWEHYFTNTLILPAVNGPTEGLMLIYFAHFFTAIVVVGSTIWKSLPFLSWVPFIHEITTYKAVLFLMVAFAVIPTLTFNVCNVYKVVQTRKKHAIGTGNGVTCHQLTLWELSTFSRSGNWTCFWGRLILAHLCDEPKGLKTGMCMVFTVVSPFAIANALTARLNDGVPLVDESLVLLGYCAFTATLYLHYATSVVHEITTALGIYCFSHAGKLRKVQLDLRFFVNINFV
ncbi:aminoalcoholphosphotransferase 1 [Prunus dulcis]|uniref:Aminoalcoholphosphotransferase 1 n=1 Tax=Prunus dulcis TaxID=3755 RepID=A0A4Y1RXX9_PRUDU|nr:aminoalcoholphosphotransferase 1 [Prunus dulcis]